MLFDNELARHAVGADASWRSSFFDESENYLSRDPLFAAIFCEQCLQDELAKKNQGYDDAKYGPGKANVLKLSFRSVVSTCGLFHA